MNPMTAAQFNSQLTGSCEITSSAPPAGIHIGFENNCRIHGVPLINVQHPMKPLGVIMCRYCPKCQEPATRWPEDAEL